MVSYDVPCGPRSGPLLLAGVGQTSPVPATVRLRRTGRTLKLRAHGSALEAFKILRSHGKRPSYQAAPPFQWLIRPKPRPLRGGRVCQSGYPYRAPLIRQSHSSLPCCMRAPPVPPASEQLKFSFRSPWMHMHRDGMPLLASTPRKERKKSRPGVAGEQHAAALDSD